jgi:hypothetical protein
MAALGACFGGIYGLAAPAVLALFFLTVPFITWYGAVELLVQGPFAGALGGMVSLALLGALGGRPRQLRGLLYGAVSGAIGLVFGAVAFVPCILVLAHRDLSQIDAHFLGVFLVGIVTGIGGGAAWGIDELAHRYGWNLIYPTSLGMAILGLLAVVALEGPQRLDLPGWELLLSASVVPGAIAGMACWSRHGDALGRRPLAVFAVSVGGLGLGMAVLLHEQPQPYQGKSVDHWNQELMSGDPDRRAVAATMLWAMLRNGDAETRLWAAHGLACGGQVTDELIWVLIASLGDADSEKRVMVTQDLVDKCPIGELAVTHGLLRALEDKNEKVRREAVRARFESAAETENLIPKLIQALKDPDPQIRQEVANTLGRMGQRARAALPVLHAALKDPNEAVRRQAAEAIDQIGPEPKDPLPEPNRGPRP